MSTPRSKRFLARGAALALLVSGLSAVGVGPAAATGCSTPPCGALNNKTNSRIGVKVDR
jgi:hypothetical protein